MAHEQSKPGADRGEAGAGENVIIDLNTADEQTLAGLPDVGPARARALIDHRPFKDWNQVKNIPEIGGEIVDVLAMHGVQIGHERSGK